MEELARNVFFIATSLDALALVWLGFFRNKPNVRIVTGLFWGGLAVHFGAVLMYTCAHGGLPLDMRTQDCLLRTCGLSAVLVFAWTKYRDRLLAQAVLLAQLLFFVAAFPIPFPADMRM